MSGPRYMRVADLQRKTYAQSVAVLVILTFTQPELSWHTPRPLQPQRISVSRGNTLGRGVQQLVLQAGRLEASSL